MSQLIKSDQLITALTGALMAHRTSQENALSVANALCQAQIDGQVGHGISRLLSYCKQAQAGKVNGFARPLSRQLSPSILRVDADSGFAFPAIDLAIEELVSLAKQVGFCVAAISQSHHFGVAGWHVERLASRGLIGLMIGNTPAAIAPWGGFKPLFGTNPIACGFPGTDAEDPIVIDLALSQVARGKVMRAAQEGLEVPEGWGVDQFGQATTSPEQILQGSMLPIGGPKGAGLALMIELLVASLTQSNMAFEASSFFSADGEPPHVGQLIIAFDPEHFGMPQFFDRLQQMREAIGDQEGVRIPGANKKQRRSLAQQQGVEISDDLLAVLTDLQKSA